MHSRVNQAYFKYVKCLEYRNPEVFMFVWLSVIFLTPKVHAQKHWGDIVCYVACHEEYDLHTSEKNSQNDQHQRGN